MVTSLAKTFPTRLVVFTAAGLLLAGCSTGEPVDAAHLTIATTPAALDQATSLAVAEYVVSQGADVEIQSHDDHEAVFAALDDETASDHEAIAVVTTPQQADTQDSAPQLPGDVDIVAQAPAELGLTPTASTVTAAQFAQAQNEQAVADDQTDPACADLTWLHTVTAQEEIDDLRTALAEVGCEPAFESTGAIDSDTYEEMTRRLITEDQTVAVLSSVDPVIADQGLATLELETEQWPNTNMVAVASTDINESLAAHVTAVVEELDSEAATDLLRGYHNAQTSTSDLQYEVDDAIRYWLANQDLMDDDTVTDFSTDDVE
ncbi:hypothetical protein GCM10027092_24280 [Yaniella soli]